MRRHHQIGLAGELRQVPDVERRIGEAARYGFRTAVVRSPHVISAPREFPGGGGGPAPLEKSLPLCCRSLDDALVVIVSGAGAQLGEQAAHDWWLQGAAVQDGANRFCVCAPTQGMRLADAR